MDSIESYVLIDTFKKIADFQEDLKLTKDIGLDLETNGLDWTTNEIRLAQFEVNDKIYFLNLDEQPIERFKYLIELIHDSQKTVVMHNGKFDIKFILAKTDIHLINVYDTMIAEVLLTAGIGTGFVSLEQLLEIYCNVKINKDIRLLFLNDTPITEEMYIYSAKDVKHLKRIKELQENKAKNFGMLRVFDLEMKLLPVVARMEYDGVLLDWKRWMELHEQSVKFVTLSHKKFVDVSIRKYFEKQGGFANALDAFEALKIKEFEDSKVNTKKVSEYLKSIADPDLIKHVVKKNINLNSTYQLQALFAGMGHKGINSTADKVLTKYISEEPLIKVLLLYKTHGKRISTYGENWKKYINKVTGRVHAEYNQVGTATGRWACNNPNLQNIIAEIDYRSCFIAREGYLLCTADYSQAELRLVGSVSGETAIITAYKNGEDIHSYTASLVYGIPLDEVTKHQRRTGKTLNFSILYGSTPWGIAVRNDDISKSEGEDLVLKFFGGYPQLGQFIQLVKDYIWERKYAKTPFGRIRFFEDKRLFEDNYAYIKYKSKLEREGFNHIIQGGSSDCLKFAIVDAFYNNPFGHDNFRFLMQVHDEVVVEIKKEIKKEAIEFLVDCMERAEQQFLGEIPAVVDYKVGKYWMK